MRHQVHCKPPQVFLDVLAAHTGPGRVHWRCKWLCSSHGQAAGPLQAWKAACECLGASAADKEMSQYVHTLRSSPSHLKGP